MAGKQARQKKGLYVRCFFSFMENLESLGCTVRGKVCGGVGLDPSGRIRQEKCSALLEAWDLGGAC